jgi:hypothetical protein
MWKLVKNLVNRQYLLFSEIGRHSKFGSILCKIRGEKHYTAFAKVVEGSEIYNFPIHHFVHFYSTFWSYACSNRDAGKRFRPADVAQHHAATLPAPGALSRAVPPARIPRRSSPPEAAPP